MGIGMRCDEGRIEAGKRCGGGWQEAGNRCDGSRMESHRLGEAAPCRPSAGGSLSPPNNPTIPLSSSYVSFKSRHYTRWNKKEEEGNVGRGGAGGRLCPPIPQQASSRSDVSSAGATKTHPHGSQEGYRPSPESERGLLRREREAAKAWIP